MIAITNSNSSQKKLFSGFKTVLHDICSRPSGAIGLSLVLFHIILALISPYIVPYDFKAMDAGSMLSTPILNLPQSGVLGMHNIVDRPTVVDGEIKIRPIMYLALSYDHRIIDGKESVSFLKMVKENLENPRRLFLNI